MTTHTRAQAAPPTHAHNRGLCLDGEPHHKCAYDSCVKGTADTQAQRHTIGSDTKTPSASSAFSMQRNPGGWWSGGGVSSHGTYLLHRSTWEACVPASVVRQGGVVDAHSAHVRDEALHKHFTRQCVLHL